MLKGLRSRFIKRNISREQLLKRFQVKFYNDTHNKWIVKDRYIKRNLDYLFSILPDDFYRFFLSKKRLCLVSSRGRYASAIIPPANTAIVMIYPELKNILHSVLADRGLAVIAHEFAHIILGHDKRDIDWLEAQVEADKFVMNIGLSAELQSILDDEAPTIENRVRMSYCVSEAFAAMK